MWAVRLLAPCLIATASAFVNLANVVRTSKLPVVMKLHDEPTILETCIADADGEYAEPPSKEAEAPSAEAMAPRTRLALQFRLVQKTLLSQCVAAAKSGGSTGMSDAAKLLARPNSAFADVEEDGAFDFSLTDLKPL